MMLCNKCRVSKPYQDDTWCLACSAVESLSAALKSRWEFPGLRETAEEAIISAARQVKTLRKLSTGLAAERSSLKSKEPASKAEAALNSGRRRSPLPRSASRTSRVPDIKDEANEKEDEESAEGEDQESYTEEEAPATGVTLPGASRLPPRRAEVVGPAGEEEKEDRRSKGSLPPPEPERPPRADRERRRRRAEDEGGERRSKRRRAGAKHKRLSRLVDNPETRVHRAFSQQADSHARRKTW